MRSAASSLLLLVTLFFSSLVFAQAAEAPPAAPPAEEDNVSDVDRARAGKLFEEGRQLIADGDLAGGCKKFGESQKIRPGIGTLYNLADCNEKLGKTGTAYTLFIEVADRTKAALQADREAKARERIAVLEPKLMKIRLAVPSGGKVKHVSIDGEKVAPENYNKAIAMDPGEHVIVAVTVKDDGEPFEEVVDLTEPGKTVTVAIPVKGGAKMKRRVGMIIGGGITAGIGVIAMGAAIGIGFNGGEIEVVAPLAALGVVGMAVGFPIFGVGFKKKPVKDASLDIPEASPIPQIAVGPTGASATWNF